MLTATDPTALTSDPLSAADTTDSAMTDSAMTDSAMTGTAMAGTALTGETVLPCWTTDPDLWFAEAPADVEAAKALCAPCPVREACLAGALERREPWGVWGGQLVVSGVVVPRKRPRGRPRKVDVAA